MIVVSHEPSHRHKRERVAMAGIVDTGVAPVISNMTPRLEGVITASAIFAMAFRNPIPKP